MGPDSPNCINMEDDMGVDMFSYYSNAVAKLLSKDDDDNNMDYIRVDSMLFEDAIAVKLSAVKREELKSLLRQFLFVLTPQVDEILDPVMKMHNLKLLLSCNKQEETCSCVSSDSDTDEYLFKKLRRSSPASLASVTAHVEEVHFLLKKDSSKVEAMIKKYSDELSITLEKMAQQLEEVLDMIMSKCRLMTLSEKEQLRISVLQLPRDKLCRATEIIGRKEGSETEPNNEDTALWRLHYYVKALQRSEVLDSKIQRP
ncbi:hypothetical protein SAY86_015972 [Trapa natans]|uniref:NET domain-containing protein n=1 Tax=Trapa natans TaxID=22666 RepID=A0AAN7LIU1_TRANT|nr:hypothetical protein SAY86_015972 [Trapa natans]